MKWIKDSGEKTLPFLKNREWAHVNLNEKVIQYTNKSVLARRRESIWILTDEMSVEGAFWFKPGGYLLPAFSSSIKECPVLPVKTAYIRGIMATMENLNVIQKQLPRPENPQDFKLMIHYGYDFTERDRLPENITVEMADNTHWKELYPLELAYQKEEVYGSKKDMDNHIIAMGLRNTLKNRDVFILKRNGIIIGKANTNSSGIIWDQLGGVYIVPDLRNRGYATIMIKFIIACLYRKNRKLSLFVKTANTSAVKLYTACGFKDKGPFHLGYYNTPF